MLFLRVSAQLVNKTFCYKLKMIENLINVFEQKFNTFADTTDAFTSRFVRDEDSAIGTLCYRNFNVEFEYCLECGGIIEKSGINIIVDFSKRTELPLKCMMYDIIGLLDKDNFNCWFYCFIESEKRMELCFDKLSSDFANVFPKLNEFADYADNLKKLEEVLQKNISATVGIASFDDIKIELEDNDEVSIDDVYDYLFNLYFGYEMSSFATNEYCHFLSGNYKKALKKYQKKKNKLLYEDAICDYIKRCDKPEPLLSEEYECLKDGLKEYSSNGFLPFAASCGVLIIPFFALCVALYFAIAFVMYHSSIYSTSLELYNSMACFLPAFLGSILGSYVFRERIYRMIFKKKYKRMMEYDAIFNTEKTEKKMNIFMYLVYILALFFVFMSANFGVSLSDTGLQVNKTTFDIRGDFYQYNEIIGAERDDYNIKLYFYDGESIDLFEFADISDVEENILPVLEQNGVEITEAENSTE